jgi:hypothetical protein
MQRLEKYMASEVVPQIGDVVIVNSMRGIVIALEAPFVTVLGIGTDITGETYVLPQRFVGQFLPSECHYVIKQTLSP